MKMYIPFGDWSNDGHGRYRKILIDAPSMESLRDAQKRIQEKYGNEFFDNFASKYEEPYLNENIWQALIDTKYPVEKIIREIEIDTDEFYLLSDINSIQKILLLDNNPMVTLNFVINIFIWLLNAYGAKIKRCEDYPMICNWNCKGFKTVGYGCFY